MPEEPSELKAQSTEHGKMAGALMMAHKHKGLISQHSLQSNSADKKQFTSRLNDQQLWNLNINKVFIVTFQWTTGLNVITALNSKSNKSVIYVNVSIWINEWNPPANLGDRSITWALWLMPGVLWR